MNQLIRQVRQAYYKQTQSEKGFSQIILLGIVAVLILIGAGGFLVLQEKKVPSYETEKSVRQEELSEDMTSPTEPSSPAQSIQPPRSETQPELKPKSSQTEQQQAQQYKNILDREWSRGKCEGSGTVQFGAPAMKPENISVIIPMGSMIGGHVTPIDHLYFYPVNWQMKNPIDKVNLYAPANGYIVQALKSGKAVEAHLEDAPASFDLIIEHTCDFYTKLGLMSDLSPRIKEKIGLINGGSYKYVRIPVTEGEVVGNVWGQSLDYFVFYAKAPPKKWIFPEHYNVEADKKFVVDPFDYYKEPVKSQLLVKNLRGVEPRGGKIDHDIDGKLIGTWFVENTNWYAGSGSVKGDFGAYWKTHVSFSPDPIDPSSFVISLGDFNGEAKQFGAKENSLNPKDVNVSSFVVKYELVSHGYVDGAGNGWNFEGYVQGLRAKNYEQIDGVVLVQLLEDRKLKMEVFPGKTGAEVNGFTSAARIYER